MTAKPQYMSDASKWHPPGLFMLCTTEMWERMSYYGMRALLVLYMVDQTKGGLAMSQGDALSLYGTYTGLVYLTPLIGGFLADNYMGQRRAVLLGGFLMMLGQFALMVPGMTAFYGGLTLLIIGNGFFKPNISTMVGGLYRPGDGRRDGAFTFFYMGINAGALIAPLICGTLGERYSWKWGFGSAGIGMAIGLVVFFLLSNRLLGEVGLSPKQRRASTQVQAVVPPFLREDLHRMIVIFVLALFVVFFWAAFEQAGGLMSLYTDSKVDRMIGSFEVPTSWLQAVNPLFIVAFGPLMAMLWPMLRRMKLEPSTPAKMAIGLFLVSGGFVLMMAAAKESEATGKAALSWVVGAYLIHTIGELCLSPVGLSMVTKLAHQRIASLMMGVWFLANAAANKLSGVVGGLSEKAGEYQVFLWLVVATAGAGALLLVLAVPLKWLAHGAEDVQPAHPTSEPAESPAVKPAA